MIAIMAWRNIWRNPARSLVVITAIALGIAAALFMSGFATGMVRNYIDSAITTIVSHMQVHHPDFEKDNDVRYHIPDMDAFDQVLKELPGIQGVSRRTVINGMVGSAQGARGVRIMGVDPAQEKSVSKLSDKMLDGAFFTGERRNEILLGRKMAEKLQVKLRSKVVLTFQDLEGNITNAAFRIAGIFDSGNTPYDEGHVYVEATDLNILLTGTGRETVSEQPEVLVHEMALILDDPARIPDIQSALKKRFPDMKVESYQEIAPDLRLYESQIQFVSMIYLTIIMLALIFGIINTMLMSVLERYRELGVLMAIGMNKMRVFRMIVLETVVLSLAGAPLGLLLGGSVVYYFGIHGINLAAFAESMKEYGLSTQVYFEVDPSVYVQVPVFLFFTAIIAAIYPALKAIRLRPVEAIRKI